MEGLTFGVAYLVLLSYVILVIGVDSLTKLWRDTKRDTWEYGTCSDRRARRNMYYKNVQFILWKKGEQGRGADCWVDFDSSHWRGFVADDRDC